MWTTERLAEFILDMRGKHLPAAVVSKVADLVLDLVGASAAGYPTVSATAVRCFSEEAFGPGASLVWFSGIRLTSYAAALSNSAAASALDVDDGHRMAIGHPGAAVIPAVIAEYEHSAVDNDVVASAIAIGYEIGVRVASAQRARQEQRMFATGRWASAAVAAAIGFMRNCDRSQLANAISIALMHRPHQIPSGTSRQLGHVKEGIPWSTLTGYAAVRLAQANFRGNGDVLDIGELFDGAELLAGLGASFAVQGTYTKPYSCCRWIHAAIDALLLIMVGNKISHENIQRITVCTIAPAVRLNNKVNPTHHYEAQFSVPFSLAVAAIYGRDHLLIPRDTTLGEAKLVEFAKRVHLVLDEVLDSQFPGRAGARVVVKTPDCTYEQLVEHPKGEPANPMDRDELRTKSFTLTQNAIGAAAAQKLSDASSLLDNGDIAGFVRELVWLNDGSKRPASIK